MFQPFPVPLTSGVREDLDANTPGNPEQLTAAKNVVYTKGGGIRGRAGQRLRDGNVIQYKNTYPASGITANGIGNLISGMVQAGITCRPSSVGLDAPLLAYQSRALHRADDGLWADTGPFWSLRKQASIGLDRRTVPGNRVSVGTQVVAVPAALGPGSGLPYIDGTGAIEALSAYSANFDAIAAATASCSGNFVMYSMTGNLLKLQVPGIFPATTEVQLAADASTTVAGWITPGDTTFHCVAYPSTTAGRVVVLRVDATGTVTHTFNVNGFGTVIGVSISYSVSRVILVVCDSTNGTLKTKSLNFSSGGISDAALDINYATTQAGVAPTLPTVGAVGGLAYITYYAGNGVTDIAYRFFNSTTGTQFKSLFANNVADKTAIQWYPAFQAVSIAGNPAIGFFRTIGRNGTDADRQAQWMVLNVADALNGLASTVLAAGPVGGCFRTAPGSAVATSTGIQFGIADGRTFDVNGLSQGSATRILLTTQAAVSRNVRGIDYFSGCTPYLYDGKRTYEVGFIEQYPMINMTGIGTGQSTMTVGGGLTPSASYSYQAVWTFIDGSGNTVRSFPSPVVTVGTTATNFTFNAVITVPQVGARQDTLFPTRVELYATGPNPSGGAPLYLVGKIDVPTGVSVVTITQALETDTTALRLYATGTVVADDRPPGGDRGIAAVGDRIWLADERRIYASKQIQPLYAPAWSSAGLHTLEIPTAVGTIQAIGALHDRLVVVCSGGVVVVYGPGYDNLGSGQGWQTQIVSRVGGCPAPRGLAETPVGVAFVGVDGEIWLVGNDLTVKCISRATRDDSTTAIQDLVYIPSGANVGNDKTTNPMLFCGGRVIDLETGMWSVWTLGTCTYFAAINGILWAQTSDTNYVVSFDTTDGKDLGVNFSMSIRTGNIGQNRLWSRIQGCTPLGAAVGNHNLTVKMYADDSSAVIMNTTQAVTANAAPSSWPYNNSPEFRCSSQRAAFVQVELIAAPALADWASIDLWIQPGSTKAPSRFRA